MEEYLQETQGWREGHDRRDQTAEAEYEWRDRQ